jgi:hypothetical protein
MSITINLRGTGGAGKTEFVRRILGDYGWKRHDPGPVEPIRWGGRRRPIAYRAPHPAGGRPLLVPGHYEATCGGCDTVTIRDGGLQGVFRFAAEHAAAGHDVLLEGLHLSAEHKLTAAYAARHPLHVVWLDTPPEACVRHLLARRRSGRAAEAATAATVAAEREAIARACERLSAVADVEALGFDEALARVRGLLGLCEGRPAARGRGEPDSCGRFIFG